MESNNQRVGTISTEMDEMVINPTDAAAQPVELGIRYLTRAGMPFVVADTFSLQSDANFVYLSLFKVEPPAEDQIAGGKSVEAYCIGRFALAHDALPVLARAFSEHMTKNASNLRLGDSALPKGEVNERDE